MIIKLLLKIWPALLPFLLYFLWIWFQKIINKINNFNKRKSKNFIEGEYQEIKTNSNNEIKNNNDDNNNDDDKKEEENTQNISSANIPPFSLKNPLFIAVIYLGLIFMIIYFLSFALQK